jgi:DNA-binding PadR family transcriptional regulator
MSTVDLMLLGVLIKKPMNAYEIKKKMELRNIQKWVRISSPSVYKNLIKLHQSGYIDGETVREGEMPEKTVYTINDKGRAYFIELMHCYSQDAVKVYIDFCTFISNIDCVSPSEGLGMIQNLRERLVEEQTAIAAHRQRNENIPYSSAAIIDLYAQMYDLFQHWAEDFEKMHIEETSKD